MSATTSGLDLSIIVPLCNPISHSVSDFILVCRQSCKSENKLQTRRLFFS